ncbi:alpha/beta fold hydrolase [Actinomarinicola tropica]|uniref:Alpha/beta fold hydrolase n=1 Tax=Actinomarinicola tropica TaxID=2789776 RepID=A0A5Q2RK68_9ACTN|nr:alpha/beta fold hydrolase [Actinomarinicola tropica]QGG94786.1 alpha/beta fold hydrolase [Actinomarinicola tropica]
MHRVRTPDGVDVAVHDLGGTGPVLLFAHATGFHGRVWQPLADRLGDMFHCLAIDFRGHGDTRVPEDHEFDWNRFGRDVLSVVDDLVVEGPVFGVGHSKGGAALLMAEAARPGTFASLWCFEPIVLPTEILEVRSAEGSNPLAEGARRRREVFDSREAAYGNYASKPPLASLDPACLRAYVDHGFEDLADGTVRLKCRGVDEAAVYSSSGTHDTFERLDDIACPVTIAAGGDGGFPATIAPRIADGLPMGRLEEHPELGHFGPLEDPAGIAARIREAFEETSSFTPLPPPAPDTDDEPVAASVAAATPGFGHAVGRIDAEIDRAWERLRGIPVVDRVFYSASALGDWSLIWHLAGAAQGVADRRHGIRRAARLSTSLGIESALVNGAIKSLFRRTRPIHDGERPHTLRMPATSSFPSGHASSAFMAARLLSDRNGLGPLWYALAAVVATSRVHVRIHHPSDVVGGAVLGIVLGEAAVRLAPLPRD